MCQDLGIENELIPQIAFLFGGGMGNTGSVCGAVCGSLMALGLRLGRSDTMDEGLRLLTVAQEFRRRFEANMGTINCRELTGADLTTPEGIQQYLSSDTPTRVCFPAVSTAYRLVSELLQETSPTE